MDRQGPHAPGTIITWRSVEEIRDALIAKQGAQALAMLSMRIMLETGVSLKQPAPDQNIDAAAVKLVVQALADMGVTL